MASKTETRKFRKELKIIEEEEINRRLKEAGLYDHNDTFEVRKQIDQMLKESIGETSGPVESCSKAESQPTSFDRDFNIVEDSDDTVENEDLKEYKVSGETFHKQQREKTNWKPLFVSDDSDEGDDSIFEKKPRMSVPVQRHRPDKGKSLKSGSNCAIVDGEEIANFPALKNETYEAMELSSPDPLPSAKILNGWEKVDTRSETAEVIIPESPDMLLSPKRGEDQVEQNSDVDDEDKLLELNAESEGDDEPSRNLAIEVGKENLLVMKDNFEEFSYVIRKLKDVEPCELPASYNFALEESIKKLIESDISETQSPGNFAYEQEEWTPIILDMPNSRRRRPIFNPAPGSTPCKRGVDRDDPFWCEIPTELSSEIDISPPSPVLESGASRNRWAISKSVETMDTEVGSEFIGSYSAATTERSASSQQCPICGKAFSLSVIEGHAAECFNYEADERVVDSRSRQERVATRATRLRNNRSDSVPSVPGYELKVGRNTPIDSGINQSDKEDSGSDFEPSTDTGAKRSRKRDLAKSKKRRV